MGDSHEARGRCSGSRGGQCRTAGRWRGRRLERPPGRLLSRARSLEERERQQLAQAIAGAAIVVRSVPKARSREESVPLRAAAFITRCPFLFKDSNLHEHARPTAEYRRTQLLLARQAHPPARGATSRPPSLGEGSLRTREIEPGSEGSKEAHRLLLGSRPALTRIHGAREPTLRRDTYRGGPCPAARSGPARPNSSGVPI